MFFRRAMIGVGSATCVLTAVAWRSECDAMAPPKANRNKVFAGVEGGGTTWRVAIAVNSPTNIVEKAVFDTTTPEETLTKVKAWLDQRKFDSLGVASFGPVDLHEVWF
jgi:hypothetical protein